MICSRWKQRAEAAELHVAVVLREWLVAVGQAFDIDETDGEVVIDEEMFWLAIDFPVEAFVLEAGQGGFCVDDSLLRPSGFGTFLQEDVQGFSGYGERDHHGTGRDSEKTALLPVCDDLRDAESVRCRQFHPLPFLFRVRLGTSQTQKVSQHDDFLGVEVLLDEDLLPAGKRPTIGLATRMLGQALSVMEGNQRRKVSQPRRLQTFAPFGIDLK